MKVNCKCIHGNHRASVEIDNIIGINFANFILQQQCRF